MATIEVDIVSAEGEIYKGEASMVFAPASMGEVGIAPRHAPLMTTLKPGEVRVQDTSSETDLKQAQAELAEAEARYRAAQKLKGKR